MEAIGHLDRLRRPLRRTLSIGAGSVARDDADGWMLLEPGGERLGVAVFKQGDGALSFEITDDRAVALAFLPGIELSRPVTEPARLQNRA
jgi:hypothetical protein